MNEATKSIHHAVTGIVHQLHRALLARLERAWSQSLGDMRTQIGIWLQEFDATLAEQKEEEIVLVRERLADYLESMKM